MGFGAITPAPGSECSNLSSCLDNLLGLQQPCRVLNPASPLPLYRQLADLLLAELQSGSIPVGHRLPSEPELARNHGIGRPTVRQALDQLEKWGVVERRRGAGTFARSPRGAVDLFSMGGTLEAFKSRGLELKTRLLERVTKRVVPADPLNPLAEREAYCFVRLGSVGNEPVLVEHVALDAEVFVDLHRVPLTGASLSHIVRTRYFLEPSHGEQSFFVACGPPETQRALGLGVRTPVLLIKRTLHFPRAPGAIFSELYCRTDRVVFSQTLGQP
jgi:GntR family transcriptional regulator